MKERLRFFAALSCAVLLGACTAINSPAGEAPAAASKATAPASWAAPQVLVPPSNFHGVHGLAVDRKGRLLAGTVTGGEMWVVDRKTGASEVFIAGPEGESDDIAIGPRGEMAWTSYLQGIIRYRRNDKAPIQELATGLPGINSLAFHPRSGKLYASQVFLGDALWEIDVRGRKKPRLIAKDMGGFNGFEVGRDGMLYGPLWFKQQVVKIHPRTGKITVIADGFQTPAAANLDRRGNLWVVDTKAGTLVKVHLKSRKKTVVAQLDTALDNLAIAREGTIYVSNMADNAVIAVNPKTGKATTLTSGELAVPSGSRLDGQQLLVADVFGFRSVDTQSGEVKDIYRMQASEMEYPFSVGVSSSQVALASWFTGTVQLLDRSTKKHVSMAHGFKAPMDAIPLDDGSVLVTEIATGQVLRASGDHLKDRQVLAKDLQGPVQMVLSADGKSVFVSEAAGRVLRVALAGGAPEVVAEKLAMPEGLAITPWGSLLVVEAAAQRITEIDLKAKTSRTVAQGLPIGLPALPGMPPVFAPTGVDVDADGVVYVTADRNNSVLKISPVR
ncbi:hypothetical protein [Hydrogenophaga sp. 5NK40-0174]|uniref:Vgb family protein n=1 Tax=Hydrogenophaga sp. 5NK40-0174 TaxID=3127649 RepID=UPI00310338C9